MFKTAHKYTVKKKIIIGLIDIDSKNMNINIKISVAKKKKKIWEM